jgi:hypothetical protein
MATVTIPDTLAAELHEVAEANGEDANTYAVARLTQAVAADKASRPNGQKNGYPKADDAITAALQTFLTYDNGGEVIEFLTQYPDAVPALTKAREAVNTHFGLGHLIYLEVVTDPDGHDAPVLILDVLTDMKTRDARDKARNILYPLYEYWRTIEGTPLLTFNVRDTSVAESE